MGQKLSVDAVTATGVIVLRTNQTKTEIKGAIDPTIETMLQVCDRMDKPSVRFCGRVRYRKSYITTSCIELINHG